MKQEPTLKILPDETKIWKCGEKFHREDGPAIIWKDGSEYWYQNGKRHREDGPAIILASGGRGYYLNNKYYRKEDWKEEMYKRNLKKVLE